MFKLLISQTRKLRLREKLRGGGKTIHALLDGWQWGVNADAQL